MKPAWKEAAHQRCIYRRHLMFAAEHKIKTENTIKCCPIKSNNFLKNMNKCLLPPMQCLLALPSHGSWTLGKTLSLWPGSPLCTMAGETSWDTMLRRYIFPVTDVSAVIGLFCPCTNKQSRKDFDLDLMLNSCFMITGFGWREGMDSQH